ncbi:MAG: NAD(P)/FAD-dependent oxidoreductase, partial [Lentisphaeria bacterium]|nr:NAD(P)/FAD-dependent oxidoreductase [Lentisphaeria bacterium]
MNILIIGGGIAAYEAALGAAENQQCNITVCSSESLLPYRRPALSRMVAEDISDAAFFFKQSTFYQEHNIDLKLNKTAVSINKEEKNVTFEDGDVLAYDRLILAEGGHSFVPPVPGAEYAHTFRDYRDLELFRRKLDSGITDAVIIGAGVLGLELADSLIAKGCNVTLIEARDTLLSRNLDPESSAVVMKHLQGIPGVTVKTNSRVLEITPDSVILENETLPSSLTVFSTGIRSNTQLAQSAGLTVNKGVIVDERMMTSDANIFCCGDAAEPPSGCTGLLPAAKSMGHVAGVNAAGGNEHFVPEAYPI